MQGRRIFRNICLGDFVIAFLIRFLIATFLEVLVGSLPGDRRVSWEFAVWRKAASNPKSLAAEVKDLVVAYLKQETLGPLKGIGRYLGFGVAGSVLVAVGLLMLMLGILRLLQSETGSAFTGNLSWLPYLITAAIATVFLAITAIAIRRQPKRF